MRTKILLALPVITLAIVIFGVTSVHAAACGETKFNDDGSIIVCPDNPDMAADYKLNYAIMYPEEFAKSKVLIYDYDIQYVEKLIKSAQEACAKSDRPDCANTVKEYQDALAKLVSIKSQQTGKPPESTPNVSPADGEKAKAGALSQLSKMGEKIKDLLKALLEGLLEVIRDTWAKLW